jgi:hypothetical protein
MKLFEDVLQNENQMDYLIHPDEPLDDGQDPIAWDIKDELLLHRHFLKHRVWRNNSKIRRHYT